MRLGDYYRGLPLNLRTALPPDEVARRIGAAISSPLRPFATGIIGRVTFNRLHLRHRSNLFSYNAMPVLTGRIKAEQGTLLLLKYRGHLATRLAFPLAFVMVAVAISIVLASGALAGTPAWVKALVLFFMLLAVTLPLLIHAFFIRDAEADLEHLAAFLRTTLEAKDVPAPPGWTGG
jgi:hypothetical protein